MTVVLNHLKAKVLENNAIAITLEMTSPNFMRGDLVFLGASMPASATPGACCSSFTLYPKKDEDGLFAVQVEEGHKVTDKKVGFVTVHRNAYFLEVTWKDGKPFAHIDTPFFPTKGIGHLHGAGGGVPSIEVVLPNGTRFCSDEGRKNPFVDGNLLCRYLVGKAKAHEILNVVVQRRLIPTREQMIKDLLHEVHKLEHKNSDLLEECRQRREDSDRLKTKFGKQEGYIELLGGAHHLACERLENQNRAIAALPRLIRRFWTLSELPIPQVPQE